MYALLNLLMSGLCRLEKLVEHLRSFGLDYLNACLRYSSLSGNAHDQPPEALVLQQQCGAE
jgi:hypothetical protein